MINLTFWIYPCCSLKRSLIKTKGAKTHSTTAPKIKTSIVLNKLSKQTQICSIKQTRRATLHFIWLSYLEILQLSNFWLAKGPMSMLWTTKNIQQFIGRQVGKIKMFINSNTVKVHSFFYWQLSYLGKIILPCALIRLCLTIWKPQSKN